MSGWSSCCSSPCRSARWASPPLLPEPAPSLAWPELLIPSAGLDPQSLGGLSSILVHPANHPSSDHTPAGLDPPTHVIPTADVVPPRAWLLLILSPPARERPLAAPPLPSGSAILPASHAWSVPSCSRLLGQALRP